MDSSTIQAGLASLQSAIDITRLINSAGGELEKAELKLRMAEIMSSLADAKVSLAEAGELISSLQQEVGRKSARESLKTWFVDGLYVILENDGQASDGPFCARCLDVDYRFIRPANDRSGETGMGYCPQCKNKYPLWNAEKRMIDDGVKSSYTG